MADITFLSRLVNGLSRNVDISANTPVVLSIKVGGGVSNTELTKVILDNLVSLQNGSDFADGTNAHTHDGRYFTETELGSATSSSGSDLIGDDNTYSNFTPTAATVKGALAGIDTALATAGGTTFSDATFRVQDNADATKEIALEASAITTGTTRTITMPDANVSLGEVNTSIQQNGSRAFTADQSMGSNKLTSLAAGTLASDAIRKDQAVLVDGTQAFAADQSMGNNKLTSLAAGTIASDAIRKDQAVLVDGSQAFTADQSMGSNKLTSLAAGTLASDAIRKDQAMLLDGTQAMTAAMDLGGFKITNLAEPTAGSDAATKTYVDGVASGLDLKASVRAATVDILDNNTSISGSPTYNNTGGSSGRGQITATLASSGVFTVDDVSMATGNRLLIKEEGEVGGLGGDANGIYIVTISGTSLTLDRSTDFDQDAEVTNGAFMFVREGTVNADTGWVLITDDPITVGGASGTAMDFTQFSGAGSFIAGDGIDKTGNQIDVVVSDFAGTGLENDGSNNLRIASTAAGAGLTGGSGSALAVGAGNGITVNADDVAVNADVTGGANLARAINVSVNGVAVKIDDTSIGENGTQQLEVKTAGITTAKIADANVTTAKIADANVTTAKIADSNVTTAKIADANVTTAKLADDSVTAAKLNADTAGAGLVQNISGALDVGAGDGIIVNADDVAVDASAIAGTGLQDDGSNNLRVASGAYDQVTITGGSGSAAAVQRAPNVTQTVIAGEAMAANTTFAVRWAVDGETAGRVYKATNDASSSDLFYVVGLVKSGSAVSAGDPVQMIKIAEHTLDAGEAFGATNIGKPVFLSTAGALTITAPSATNTAVVRVGMLKSTTVIDVMAIPLGVN